MPARFCWRDPGIAVSNCIWMYDIFLIHSSVYRCLGLFLFFAVVNNTQINTGVQVSPRVYTQEGCVWVLWNFCFIFFGLATDWQWVGKSNTSQINAWRCFPCKGLQKNLTFFSISLALFPSFTPLSPLPLLLLFSPAFFFLFLPFLSYPSLFPSQSFSPFPCIPSLFMCIST